MQKYNPGHFSSTFNGGNGPKLWAFLNEPHNIIRMETACYLSRPAVEPLSPSLCERFGEELVTQDRIKMMIGHMARQILEGRGYLHDRKDVRITRNDNIFRFASRYKAAD
jgi:hypothetical protein